MGISKTALAHRMGKLPQWLSPVITGKRAITAETAILLARELNTTPEFWMNLQTAVDLWRAQHKPAQDGGLVRAKRPHPIAARSTRGDRPKRRPH
jgi:addiction module HigA family antidote